MPCYLSLVPHLMGFLIMEYYKNYDLADIIYFCDFDNIWKTEQWKDIPNYEGLYKISNLGRIKSYKSNSVIFLKLTEHKLTKYIHVTLSKVNKNKNYQVHQLSAITFLNHKPCGHKFVVNHKDFNKLNNSIYNLEIVTNRENSNKKHIKSSSEYTGVSYITSRKKWASQIFINGKAKNLGRFNSELEAKCAYDAELKNNNL